MDIDVVRALTPVSGPSSSTDRNASAAGTMGPAAAPAVVAPPRVPQIDTEAIARRLQDFLQSSDRDIEFRVDADTGTQVVTVRDATTGDIIRQMPGEEVLRAFKNLDLNHGAIFDAVI